MALTVKNPPANAGEVRDGFSLWDTKIPWRRAWQPTPVFLPGESNGQRNLEGSSPWSHKESDTTEATEHEYPKYVKNSDDSIIKDNFTRK